MKKILLAVFMMIGFQAQAAVPQAVSAAADGLKTKDIRTVVTETHQSNPCDAGYNIDIQVLLVKRVGEDGHDVHYWKTIKTVNADSEGHIMEICEE